MFNARKYPRYHPINLPDRTWPEQRIEHAPKWCAVDLRDGNQALLEPMDVEQKQRLFDLLVKLGFKEIEVGFPSASQPDFDFVRRLIEEDRIPDDVTIQVLTQAREHLIARTYESLVGVKRAVVHVYNSTSTVQREQVFQQDKAGIQAMAVQGARWVRDYAAHYPQTQWSFQYSPESFSGTEPDYALAVCNAVLDEWQPSATLRCIINLPATVEMTTPNVFADQVEYICRHIRYREHIDISIHTHNDRGCGVAAAELALLAGADRIEGTLLGNGERTGNMDLVTMAMNLYSQGIDPQLDLSDADEIIRTVEACTQLPVHPRHPWVGELVFTAFSGSHQDAINKCLQRRQREDELWHVAYLPIDPTDLGRDYQAVIRVNSQSGKGGAAFILQREYDLHLPRYLQLALSPVVQQAAEQSGGELRGEHIHACLQQAFGATDSQQLKHIRWDDQQGLLATLHSHQHEVLLQGQGNGPLDAFSQALSKHCGTSVVIQQFDEHALGKGSDARAVVYVAIKVHGRDHYGYAEGEDSTAAALSAVLNALAHSGALSNTAISA
ncbi:2-isopropylmalate synthase [Atopomonas sediminilitoris]|uniref:2-isopropylmalate synthase n=1 Tax=Atopomonas sediminilitoris TaxID=2919919 RepID=UPI001F4DE03B|nr:2-isopropylmalate synthase [Atopomonas sediminilitoris]MCJ8169172.1 2-isopropylmalate synthase [Atopomonas sediminilitoris]